MTETLTGTVGELVRQKAIMREDVESAAAGLFNGKTLLSLSDEYELVLPALKELSSFHRETIISALLLAKAAKAT